MSRSDSDGTRAVAGGAARRAYGLKNTGLALMLTLCLFLTTACAGGSTQGQPQEQEGDAAEETVKILSPVTIPYLIQNPLIVNTAEDPTDPAFYQRTLKLSGLKDKEIENGIMEELAATRDRMSSGGLPAYRGIKRLLKPDAELAGNTLEESLSFNYNNVASIIIYNNKTYVNPDSSGTIPARDSEAWYGHSLYVGMTEALNFDLNTGRQIKLKDVFADDADYIGILNDYLREKLVRSNADDEGYYSGVEMYGLKMAAPFTGISEDQDFFLFQGGLGLIFDQDDPQFDTGMYPQLIYINFSDLGDTIAVTKRFYDTGQDIYESNEPIVKEFLQVWNGKEVVMQKNDTVGRLNVYYSARYPEDMPDPVITAARALYEPDPALIGELSARAEQEGSEGAGYEQYVWAGRVGTFINLTRSTNISYKGQWETTTESRVFDENGREVEIADLFKPGYDYETTIKASLQKTIDQMERKPEATLDELYGGMSFSIGLAEISFLTKPVRFDEFSVYPINFYMPYKEIGCDNLTIFD